MLDHLSIQCADVAASAAFYDAVLATLGGGRIMDFGGQFIGYGIGGKPDFWIGVQTTGAGFRESHIAFPPDDIAAMGSPATPDALRTIVAKHQRTRTRTLGIALAVALVAGPLAGWAIGNSGGGGGQQVATGSNPAGSNADLPASANAPADV